MTYSVLLIFFICSLSLMSCGVARTTYKIGKGTVKATYYISKGIVKGIIGTGKVVYKVGGFTFNVAMAPLSWPLTRDGLESIDDLPPKDAIQKGRVKNQISRQKLLRSISSLA